MHERLNIVHRILDRAIVAAETVYDFDTDIDEFDVDEDELDDNEPPIPQPERPFTVPTQPAVYVEAYVAILKLCGKYDTGIIANRLLLRKCQDASDSIVANWFKKGPKSLPAVKSIDVLAKLDMSEETLFHWTKNLFYQFPFPELAASDLKIPVLQRWGTIQSMLAQSAYIKRVGSASKVSLMWPDSARSD